MAGLQRIGREAEGGSVIRRDSYRVVLLCALLAGCGGEPAPRTPCEELKAYIAKKVSERGVRNFTLQILPADEAYSGRVVGTCENGTKKIIYRRGS